MPMGSAFDRSVPKEVIDAAPNLQVTVDMLGGIHDVAAAMAEAFRRLYTQRQRFVRCRMDVDGHRRWLTVDSDKATVKANGSAGTSTSSSTLTKRPWV